MALRRGPRPPRPGPSAGRRAVARTVDVTGTVVDAQQKPLAGVPVRAFAGRPLFRAPWEPPPSEVHRWTCAPGRAVEIVSGAGGAFRVATDPSVETLVVAGGVNDPLGFAAATVRAPGEPLVLAPRPGARVTGSVVYGGDHAPPPAVPRRAEPERPRRRVDRGSARCAAEGRDGSERGVLDRAVPAGVLRDRSDAASRDLRAAPGARAARRSHRRPGRDRGVARGRSGSARDRRGRRAGRRGDGQGPRQRGAHPEREGDDRRRWPGAPRRPADRLAHPARSARARLSPGLRRRAGDREGPVPRDARTGRHRRRPGERSLGDPITGATVEGVEHRSVGPPAATTARSSSTRRLRARSA